MKHNIRVAIWTMPLPCLAMVLGLAIIGTATGPNPAAASGTPPNFQAYCNQNYPNSTFQTDFDQYGPRYSCRQVNTSGATLQNIGAAEACQAQTGSSEIHQHKGASGRPYHCGPDTQTNPLAGPNPDYARYCRENFPSSNGVEVRYYPEGPKYYCRLVNVNGFTLQEIVGPGGGNPGFGGGGGGMNGPRPTAMHLDPCGDGGEGRTSKDVAEFWDDILDELKDTYEDAIDDDKPVTEAERLAAKDAAEEAMDEGGNRWDAAYAAATAVRYFDGTLAAAGKAAYDAMIAHGGTQSEATDAASWAIQRVAQIRTKWQVRDLVRHDRACSRSPQQVQYNILLQRQQAEENRRRRAATAAIIMGSFFGNDRHHHRRRHHRRRDHRGKHE